MGDRQVEADEYRLHQDCPGKARAERGRRVAEPSQRGREPIEALADPFGMDERSGWSSRVNPCGIRKAGVAIIAARPNPVQSTPAPMELASVRRGPAVAPIAAIITSPSRPMPRSMSTTVVASVFDPAAGAVSAIRMTSPPMLLGRKLLKNVATRNDETSLPNGRLRCWASSSSPHRHALMRIIAR